MPSTHVGTEDCKKYHLFSQAETLSHNVLRCHYQLEQWYGALKSDPPVMNPIEWDGRQTTPIKLLSPRIVLGDVPLAPKSVLKLIRCGCESARPCKGNHCVCTGQQVSCSIFCACRVDTNAITFIQKVIYSKDDDEDVRDDTDDVINKVNE